MTNDLTPAYIRGLMLAQRLCRIGKIEPRIAIPLMDMGLIEVMPVYNPATEEKLRRIYCLTIAGEKALAKAETET